MNETFAKRNSGFEKRPVEERMDEKGKTIPSIFFCLITLEVIFEDFIREKIQDFTQPFKRVNPAKM